MGSHWRQGANGRHVVLNPLPRLLRGRQGTLPDPRSPAPWLGQFRPMGHMLCCPVKQDSKSEFPLSPFPLQSVPLQQTSEGSCLSWSCLSLGEVLSQKPKSEPHRGLTSRLAAVLQRGEMSRNWLSESAPLVYCHCAGPFLPRGETCTEIGLVFCKSLLHTHTFSLGLERVGALWLDVIQFRFPDS